MPKIEEVTFKIVISDPKTGLSIQREVKGEDVRRLIGLKIGDVFDGSIVGLDGYKLKITGGSDFAGFPMRKEISGTGKKRIWVYGKKGERWKALVRGNTVSEEIVQINTVIEEYGQKSFDEIYKSLKEEKQE